MDSAEGVAAFVQWLLVWRSQQGALFHGCNFVQQLPTVCTWLSMLHQLALFA
jgi:hypothetical protein